MNESYLEIFGTSYITFSKTARENTNPFIPSSQRQSRNKKIRTKNDFETMSNSIKIGTTNLQSHRTTRYGSIQNELQLPQNCCKNYKCLHVIAELQEQLQENQKTIKNLIQQIEILKREINTLNQSQNNTDLLKEKLIQKTSKVQVQKSIGLLGINLENQIFIKNEYNSQKRVQSSHFRLSEQISNNSQNTIYESDYNKLIEIYSQSQINNYIITKKPQTVVNPYVRCYSCQTIKHQHIIKLDCKHYYHPNCLITILLQQLQLYNTKPNCKCGQCISINLFRQFQSPETIIISQIIMNYQLLELIKNIKQENVLKCIKEYCYFVIINSEEKVSYCPLCCEFNLFVQIKFI